MRTPDFTKNVNAAHTTYKAKCYIVDTDGGWECELHEIMGAAGVDHTASAVGVGDSPESSITNALADLHERWDAE